MSYSNFYIIIVTYNGASWVSKCLKSCNTKNIIVIDNNSTDNTLQVLEENFPDIVILPQKKNLGFGQANNIGITYALKRGADYVFLLNQDAYIQTDTIEMLIDIHKKHSDFGILSPIHFDGKGNSLDKNFSNYIGYNKNKNIIGDALKGYLNSVYEIPFVNAAAWLLPRETLEKIGGFDPLFFHYGEDDNYCQRVLFHNFKIGIVPNSFIAHDRENNLNSEIKIFSKQYLDLKERIYKFKFANINDDKALNLISREFYNLRKHILISLLKLNYKKFRGFILLYKRLKDIEGKIIYSYSCNKEKKAHYLNL